MPLFGYLWIFRSVNCDDFHLLQRIILPPMGKTHDGGEEKQRRCFNKTSV